MASAKTIVEGVRVWRHGAPGKGWGMTDLVEVRIAAPADAEGVAALLSTVAEESEFLGERGLKPAPESLLTLFQVDATRFMAVVAERDGTLAGYAHAIAGMPTTMRHVGVVAVAVDASFRRQGIGLLLLNGLTAETRRTGWGRLRASVWANNDASRRLFERAGFRLDGEIPEQLKGQDGALVTELIYGLKL
jgi:L-amino acid N-acyltransferase YncA